MLKLIAAVTSLSLFVLIASISYTFAAPANEENISYGTLERQKYDQYIPNKISPETPILLFIYGGSWDSGDKSKYAFVGKTFAKEGFITIIPDYRLFPQVTFPAFIDDIALSFAKVRQKFPKRKIFIAGHSAGAQIGSLLTLDHSYLKKHSLSACREIAGFIGLAGPYDFEITEDKFKQIFPAESRSQTQAVNFASSKSSPSLLLHGAVDTTVHAEDSKILKNKLEANGNAAEMKIYPAVGHINIVAALAPLLGILAPTKGDMVEFMTTRSKTTHSC
jgi:acetyl esterase/lipase